MQPHEDPAARIATGTRFSRLVHVTSCESTQALAHEDREAGSAVFTSDHQSAGRGRQGRTWHDEAGKDLAVTFKVAELVLPQPALLAAFLPVAVLESLEQQSSVRLTLKWPNDLMISGRKLAGILIDSFGTPAMHLVGIGVNVNRTGFPPELRGNATSLALVTGREFDRREMLSHLAVAVDRALADLQRGHTDRLLPLFRERLGLLGRRVVLVCGGEERHGRLTAIDFAHATLDQSEPVPLAIVQGLRQA